VCGTPLDPVLAEAGITTHPCCDPGPDGWPDGSVDEAVNYLGADQSALIPATNGHARNQPKRQPRNQRHGKQRYPA
jgi:hypothetical protein